MRVLAGLAICFALLAATGCGSDSDTERSQDAQRAARQARVAAELRQERRLERRREEAQARRQAARRQAKAEAARQRARREAERVEAEELERAELEESEEASECDPSYSGACLDPYASDYDCEGGSGDGPEYTGSVAVVGEDHYGLDSDGDGYGCE
jgi:hypothetical protein